MLRVGGASFNNGIIFYTDNIRVKATRCKNGAIEVTSTILKKSSLAKFIEKIPFLRGVIFALPSKFIFKTMFLLVSAAEIICIVAQSTALKYFELKLLPSLLFAALAVCSILIYSHLKNSNWLMYHGAEHKIIHAIDKSKVTLDDVKKESTKHRLCGTVYMLILLPILAVFYVITRYFALSYLIASSIAFEIHGMRNPMNLPIVKYVFRFFLFIQGALVKEPNNENIEVGIACINELRLKEHSCKENK